MPIAGVGVTQHYIVKYVVLMRGRSREGCLTRRKRGRSRAPNFLAFKGLLFISPRRALRAPRPGGHGVHQTPSPSDSFELSSEAV